MDLSASPTLALGVLGASLLGSLHCAAMCGGFACLYGGDAARRPLADTDASGSALSARAGSRHRARPLLRAHAAYHGGRLGAYASLGAVAGVLGAGVDQLGRWAGVQRAAGVTAGVLLVLWGVALLANTMDVRLWPALVRSGVSDNAARAIGGMLRRFEQRTPAVRASVLGLLTGLLPCGWLYAFVVTAAGTGSAWRGAAFMAVFWLGTVPALVVIATGMRRATGAMQARLPMVSAVIVIAFGVAALSGRVGARHGAVERDANGVSAVNTVSRELAHDH
jgi:hypothetical protein